MSAAEKIEHETRVISLALLRPFPRNPRGPIDKTAPKYLELRASMRKDGQLQDCVVRPVPGQDALEEYEVLVGHRRLAAAEDEALTGLRCTVREDLADDDAAYHVALAENLQRDDLTPLEEADAYYSLLDPRRPSIEDVASRVGKSVSHVRERLVLRGLIDELRELAPKIDVGALQALASSSERVQSRIAGRLRTILEHQPRVTRMDVSRIFDTENTTRSLAVVTWDLTDPTLVPAAGACNVCPKRTGQGLLLDDTVGADNACTDDSCFASKGAAQWERTAAEERARGTKVLSTKEAERVIEHGRPKPDSAYVSAEEKVLVGDKMVRVENLLNAAVSDGKIAPVIGKDPEMLGPITMFQRKDVDAAVKAAKAQEAAKKKAKASTPAEPKKVDPKRAEIEAREKHRERVDELTRAIAIERARADAHIVAKRGTILARLVAYQFRTGGLGEPTLVARSRGVKLGPQAGSHHREAIDGLNSLARRYAKSGEDDELLSLLYELFVGNAVCEESDALVKEATGLDMGELAKEAERRLSAPAPAAAKPKKGGRK